MLLVFLPMHYGWVWFLLQSWRKGDRYLWRTQDWTKCKDSFAYHTYVLLVCVPPCSSSSHVYLLLKMTVLKIMLDADHHNTFTSHWQTCNSNATGSLTLTPPACCESLEKLIFVTTWRFLETFRLGEKKAERLGKFFLFLKQTVLSFFIQNVCVCVHFAPICVTVCVCVTVDASSFVYCSYVSQNMLNKGHKISH